MRRILVFAGAVLALGSSGRADNPYLYGIHWWGFTNGQIIDENPTTMLDAPAFGGWDVETVLTHSDFWWGASWFVPLYTHLTTNRNMTIITRLDYKWGQTIPPPTSGDYAGWPASCVSTVNTLAAYCHIWVIGNEPNLTDEGGGWPSSQIPPADYAIVYRNVRNAILSSAGSSPLGTHLVLIAGASPGAAGGTRWMDGNTWLGQVIDAIPASEIDGFAIHAYGDSGLAVFQNQYRSQVQLIDAKGLASRGAYMAEFGRAAADAAGETAAAQFIRDAYADVNTWNQTAGNHDVVCMAWFVYDRDQQAGNGWNTRSIEYWRTNGNALGTSNDLFTAFEQTVDLRYPAGSGGSGGGGGMIDSPPSGTNLAPSSTQVTTDSNNSGSEPGSKAIDGIVASSSKWASAGTAPPHWLALDLGLNRTANGFVVRHAGAGGEATYFNTEQFKIQSGTSIGGPWVDEVSVSNTTQANVTNRTYTTPKALRYVRLYITDAGIDNWAHIPEFEVWCQSSGSPTITRSPATLSPSCNQGQNAANQTFTVQNTGGGTLSYSINDNATWLSQSPATGTSTGEVDTITVSYATSGLAVGAYNATITIGDPAATNNPQTIAVTLTVNAAPPAPTITRAPATLSPSVTQGSNVGNQTFTVQNTGGGTLNYSISDNVTWLASSPATGTSTGEQDTITVSYTTSSLNVGTYTGTITISDPAASNNPQTIPVTLTVNKKTASEDFTAMPAWDSTWNATWGGAATWSIVSGGQAGNALQTSRSNTGSSVKVRWFTISPSANYTVSVWIKCPSSTSAYWAECAYKFGNQSGSDFDNNGGTWTMIKKFANPGTNGNSNTWTNYQLNFSSGTNTQISVGFKLGNSSGTAPTVLWDTLQIQ